MADGRAAGGEAGVAPPDATGVGAEVTSPARVVTEAIADLRAIAASLRSDAQESRGAYLDPTRILEAAGRLEEIARAVSRSIGLDPADLPVPGVGQLRALASRPRALVVDDDPDQRDAFAMVLEPAYEVLTATDGEECVAAAREERPDLILMDLFMPRLDGLGALERLRSDRVTADIPVILVSARADEGLRVRGLDLGAADVLVKPISEHELRARLDRVLRLARSQTVLRELAETDPLTGLANLRAFRARLVEEVKRARRYRTPLSCVMADMDRLKAINDELGHAAGDLAIGAVARVFADQLRETDFGARYGGDEFVLLLPHTSREEGRVFAERLCARLRASPLSVSGRRLGLAASFGVAELEDAGPQDGGSELVRAADAALYEAKRAGRGRVAVWRGSS